MQPYADFNICIKIILRGESRISMEIYGFMNLCNFNYLFVFEKLGYFEI